MLRRLHHDQPESFAFTAENQAWAEGQLKKYPEGREASAVIPLLWRAQEQEGWLSRPAIEHVADMLGMARIRALEVATFYFMFQLKPVGRVAHVQVCGTLSCMLCGAEDLAEVCKDRIARKPLQLSDDGNFSWEEVECLGACANAPMVQIGKDYYEDLDQDSFGWILDELGAGRVPPPGSYRGRFASEPEGGPTSLIGEYEHKTNASVGIALQVGDSIKRIDGRETAFSFARESTPPVRPNGFGAATGVAPEDTTGKTEAAHTVETAGAVKPALFETAPDGVDDLQQLKGVGPTLERTLNDLGVYRFEQIASWGVAEIAWVDARLKFKGRIGRDDWVGQAATLAANVTSVGTGERG
ncbi:MAG: NADH-quinone oxidoreductase subunit NuoE [Pseudomonadota bacterium]